jgi:haloalkane dehalogenase
MPVSADFSYQKRTVTVLGQTMAYVDEGEGDPIVLLHGNPTSSYLWRNVLPHLKGLGRCVVPDLIGMGDSAPLPDSGPDRYAFAEHYAYLKAFLTAVGVENRVTWVVHDWGSGLGFHWTREHPDAVRGLAYMEALVCPIGWTDWPETARGIFQGFRSEKGENLILERNLFIEGVLPNSVLRQLTEAEMDAYRAPFVDGGERRRPMLSWPRQLPIEGEPADVNRIVRDYETFLQDSPIPKLFINANPGSILVGRQREVCRGWANQSEVTVKGLHFIQEDSPDEIGAAVADFIGTLR